MGDRLPATTLRLDERDGSDLPYETFRREYVAKNRPVIVHNATPAWVAMSKWTPEYFRTRFGDKLVSVSYQERMTFADFIDGVLASTEDQPGPYMHRLFLHEHLPEVLPDVSPQNPYAFPRWYASPLMMEYWRRPDGYIKLLIGGVGGRFPVLHYDTENVHATVTEIYGDKEFVLYAPSDTPYLYPNPKQPNQSLLRDPHHADTEQFPLFARAQQYRTILKPGDMVFVPCGWWHTARALSPSISIGMNILDGTNWDGFVGEVCASGAGLRPKTVLKKAYLGALGRFLGWLDRLQAERPRLAHALAFPHRLAPASSAVAPDPAKSPLRIRIPTY
jgi:hypothetical protein